MKTVILPVLIALTLNAEPPHPLGFDVSTVRTATGPGLKLCGLMLWGNGRTVVTSSK